jgi:hypothetical protein
MIALAKNGVFGNYDPTITESRHARLCQRSPETIQAGRQIARSTLEGVQGPSLSVATLKTWQTLGAAFKLGAVEATMCISLMSSTTG